VRRSVGKPCELAALPCHALQGSAQASSRAGFGPVGVGDDDTARTRGKELAGHSGRRVGSAAVTVDGEIHGHEAQCTTDRGGDVIVVGRSGAEEPRYLPVAAVSSAWAPMISS